MKLSKRCWIYNWFLSLFYSTSLSRISGPEYNWNELFWKSDNKNSKNVVGTFSEASKSFSQGVFRAQDSFYDIKLEVESHFNLEKIAGSDLLLCLKKCWFSIANQKDSYSSVIIIVSVVRVYYITQVRLFLYRGPSRHKDQVDSHFSVKSLFVKIMMIMTWFCFSKFFLWCMIMIWFRCFRNHFNLSDLSCYHGWNRCHWNRTIFSSKKKVQAGGFRTRASRVKVGRSTNWPK